MYSPAARRTFCRSASIATGTPCCGSCADSATRRCAGRWFPREPTCSTWSSTSPPTITSGSAGPSASRPSRCPSRTTIQRPTCALDRGESTEDVLAFYVRARAACDRVIAEYELDDVRPTKHGFEVSLRWLLVHMI